ncbi:hypothetical protein LINPERPRIM_LOCUS35087, partial [Linum perenne]
LLSSFFFPAQTSPLSSSNPKSPILLPSPSPTPPNPQASTGQFLMKRSSIQSEGRAADLEIGEVKEDWTYRYREREPSRASHFLRLASRRRVPPLSVTGSLTEQNNEQISQ